MLYICPTQVSIVQEDTMDFSQYVELHRARIYSKICYYIPIREPEEHYLIVRDYSDRQGKYRRPGLLMLAGELFGASPEKLILPAAAMQLSEDWILMHDDFEDDSSTRRGLPALHKIYGYAQAINGGDAAHIIMWKMLGDYSKEYLSVGFGLYDKFYEMLTKTVEGQYHDIKFIHTTKRLRGATEELYFKIASLKTSYYSLYGPMQLGATAAGAPEEAQNLLQKIGEPAGLAFQIIDDVLDMTSDEKTFGKQRYGDLYEGKLTLIVLHAYENASASEKERMDLIFAKERLAKTDDDISFLVSTIEKYDGIGYAKNAAEEYGGNAEEALAGAAGILPENEYSSILHSAITEMFRRKI